MTIDGQREMSRPFSTNPCTHSGSEVIVDPFGAYQFCCGKAALVERGTRSTNQASFGGELYAMHIFRDLIPFPVSSLDRVRAIDHTIDRVHFEK